MSKLEWQSETEKWISIGYLARHGVIGRIEATVPKGKTGEFKTKYHGHYDDNFPYEADKYGKQFRIYINDTDNCPSFLYKQLDDQYHNRINDTEFIEELVLEWGFRFSNKEQPGYYIQSTARKKGKEVYDCFNRGFEDRGRLFLDELKVHLMSDEICYYPQIKKGNREISGANNKTKVQTNQPIVTVEMPTACSLPLGWTGEAYIYRLLQKPCEDLYNELGIANSDITDIVWFNEGYLSSELRWKDQSVGNGCDLLLTGTKGTYYIEVKSSKRSYPTFSMTSSEIKKMEKAADRYFLVKVNYMERLVYGGKPDVLIYKMPYQYFFNVDRVKEATFYLG